MVNGMGTGIEWGQNGWNGIGDRMVGMELGKNGMGTERLEWNGTGDRRGGMEWDRVELE